MSLTQPVGPGQGGSPRPVARCGAGGAEPRMIQSPRRRRDTSGDLGEPQAHGPERVGDPGDVVRSERTAAPGDGVALDGRTDSSSMPLGATGRAVDAPAAGSSPSAPRSNEPHGKRINTRAAMSSRCTGAGSSSTADATKTAFGPRGVRPPRRSAPAAFGPRGVRPPRRSAPAARRELSAIASASSGPRPPLRARSDHWLCPGR
jgi:hypothetical protein